MPSIARLHLGGRRRLRDIAVALADAGAGLVLAAHRQLHAVDAARAPLDAAEADRGVEQGKMLVGHGWLQIVPGSHAELDLLGKSRLGNCCDPPGFRESCTAGSASPAPASPSPQNANPSRQRIRHGLSRRGRGQRAPPLVCVHGSLCDFRIWGCVLGPLTTTTSRDRVSLRHFFPEHWDGVGDTYSIAQHVDDVIAFIEKLDAGPVDLMGHSRGGHISFRVAQRRPDLLRRLILAEPGGELDATLDPDYKPAAPRRCWRGSRPRPRRSRPAISTAGSQSFVDTLEGPGPWQRLPATDEAAACATTPIP